MRFGIDLGGTKIELIALDDSGLEVFRARMATPQGDYAATLDGMVQLVQQAEATLGVSGTLGIGTPGAVSKLTGSIKNSNSICLNGRPLREDLEDRLKRPVRMANDADCFALSEAVDGAGKGYGTVFGVILGTGVGGGIVVGGRLLQGPNAIAGEWGHNPLPWMSLDEYPGPPCYCGKKGCIETLLSGPGLSLDHQAKTGLELKPPAILESAEKGDPEAEATFWRYEDRLARALAHVINLIDPEVIVLGGGLSNCDRLYTAIPARWGRYIFSDQVITPLLPPVHGDSGGVRGAAWLWGS